MRLPEERGDPLLRKHMEDKRARGEIPNRFLRSMRDHQKKAEEVASKKMPEKLRSSFDFDLWGEKGSASNTFLNEPLSNIFLSKLVLTPRANLLQSQQMIS